MICHLAINSSEHRSLCNNEAQGDYLSLKRAKRLQAIKADAK